MKKIWDQHYSQNEFAYGKSPNWYFSSMLEQLPKGKILFPCEGEGRNAVHAAKQGWEVDAFDYSQEGVEKAIRLANELNESIHFEISDVQNFDYKKNIMTPFVCALLTLRK